MEIRAKKPERNGTDTSAPVYGFFEGYRNQRYSTIIISIPTIAKPYWPEPKYPIHDSEPTDDGQSGSKALASWYKHKHLTCTVGFSLNSHRSSLIFEKLTTSNRVRRHRTTTELIYPR